MQTRFLEKVLTYDGKQLSSHFAFKQMGLLGDSCVAFIGPCQVELAAMVDLEDVRRVAPIFSQKMLHFILESFSFDLKGAVAFQRLMVAIIQEQLFHRQVSGILRKGDDLYLADKKLSVSIATSSPVSTMVHLGLNVLSQGTPVPTIGLTELGLNSEEFAKDCLQHFREEYEGIMRTTWKVRSVE